MTWWSGKWAGDDERSNCASIGDTHPSVLRSNAAPELCTCLVSTSRARTRTEAAPYLEVLASSKAPRASIFVDKTSPAGPAFDKGNKRLAGAFEVEHGLLSVRPQVSRLKQLACRYVYYHIIDVPSMCLIDIRARRAGRADPAQPRSLELFLDFSFLRFFRLFSSTAAASSR